MCNLDDMGPILAKHRCLEKSESLASTWGVCRPAFLAVSWQAAVRWALQSKEFELARQGCAKKRLDWERFLNSGV